MGRSNGASIFKVEEEGDVEAFLAGLSGDEEGDNTNMDDLKSYLKTLDQDRQSINGVQSSREERPKSKGNARAKEKASAEAQAKAQVEAQARQVEAQARQAKHQKAVKAATRLLDVLIEQAVKTSEVNQIIAAAEAKAMAEEAELGVVLAEHGWQEAVRAQVVGRQPSDDFGGLMSSIAAAGSKMPVKGAQGPGSGYEAPLLPIQPADDFRFLSGAGAASRGHGSPAGAARQQQAGALPGLKGTLPAVMQPGMARYSAARIPT